MMKNIWIYVLVAIAVGAGGWFVVTHRETKVVQSNTQPERPIDHVGGQTANTTDDVNRRRQEGIGSIKNLTPVDIGSSAANGSKWGK